MTNGGTVLISGAAALNLGTIGGAAGTANHIVDASTMTGALTVSLSGGNDTITGGSGNDNLVGGAGVDVVNGGAGDDTVTGGAGNDTVNGGAGNDNIIGGLGVDTMSGGAGADIFVFALGDTGATAATADVITGFSGDTIRHIATNNVAGASGTAGTTATTDVQVSAGGKVTFAAADDTLAEKLVAIEADNTDIANNEVVFFEDSGNTYIYGVGTDTTAVGNDEFLIVLQGVTGLTTLSESLTTAGDFSLV
jgi:hypothetical protein